MELLQYLEGFMTRARVRRIGEVLSRRTRYVTLVLEDLVDPHNASACLRSAEACGVQDVHIIENRHAFEVKTGVSMGSAQWLTMHRYRFPGITSRTEGASPPWKPVESHPPGDSMEATNACFHDLRRRGYTIYATSPHGSSVSLPELDLSRPSAIVFGSEKDGISAFARRHADHCLHIPMVGFTESFNISVCAAIALYDLTRRLRSGEVDWQLSEQEKRELRLQWARHSLRRSEMLEAHFRRTRQMRGDNAATLPAPEEG